MLFIIKGFCSYKLFQISHDYVLKIYATCNYFYKICPFFSCDQERDREIQFFVEIISNRKGKLNFWACKETPKFPTLVGHPNLAIRRMVDLLTEWFWKEWVRVFSFKATNLQHVRLRIKNVANPLMAFNLLRIIHPFQSKKHLRI